MARQITINDSLTVNPSNYTGLTNLTVSSTQYPVSNGYTDTSSTSYARFTTTYNSAGYCYYTFSITGIPTGSTISSVTASAKVRINNTGRVSNTNCQLYYSTTAKGSSATFASTNSSNIVNLSNTGSWTLAELSNLRLRIGGTGSNQNNSGYIYFYGANITINYSFQGMAYTIAASSMIPEITVDPSSQELLEGESATIRIDAANLEDISVTDNDIDITESLTRHNNSSEQQSPTFIPSSFDSTNSSYSSVYNNNNPENGLTNSTSTTRCCVYSNTTNGSESSLWYNFDCSSIPSNAIISSVTCTVGASCYSSGSYFSTKELQLFVGTSTPKGSAVTVTGNGSTSAQHTVNGGTSWTRSELNNLKIRFYVVRSQTGDASFSFFGATLTVNYTLPVDNPYYWTYTWTNLAADHIILIDQTGVYIPPEEDPQYTYHSLTISSINATTNPVNGTTRVIEGTNNTITILPTDPQLTLALDNGVDITSQLQGGIPTNTYTITNQVSGANYGFNLNSGTGYYISTNTGQASSAAVCRINFNFETACLVTISYINYAEATYDYGIFGNIDTALGTTSTADSNAYHSCNASSENTANVQTLTYNIPSGTHYIDIKYRKDSYTDSNNDNLQWKIDSVESTEGAGSYTYTLNNIQTNHSLVFVFGNVTYWFVNSSGTNCRIFPDGQQVKLDGQSYTIKIVPDNITDSIVLTDNNVEQTLEREDGYDKDDNPVVSYTYKISSIHATHTIVVTGILTGAFFIKSGNTWLSIAKLYVKENGIWTEQLFSYIEDEGIQHIRQG